LSVGGAGGGGAAVDVPLGQTAAAASTALNAMADFCMVTKA
jgi:hypothetical protein